MEGLTIDGYYIPVIAALVLFFTATMAIVHVNRDNKYATAWGTAFFGTAGLASGVIAASYGWEPTQGGFLHTVLWIFAFLTLGCFIATIVLYSKNMATKGRPMKLPRQPASRQETQPHTPTWNGGTGGGGMS